MQHVHVVTECLRVGLIDGNQHLIHRDAGRSILCRDTPQGLAALHGPSAFLPIFGLSLVLGAVMLRTQRLVAAWGIHALHNGIQVAALQVNGRPIEDAAGLLTFFSTTP